MKRTKFLLYIIVFTFFNMTVAPILSIGGAIPNLVIIWMINSNFEIDRLDMILGAFLSGLCFDFSFSNKIGIHTLVLVIFAYAITTSRLQEIKENWYNRVLLLAVGTLLYHLIFASVLYFSGYTLSISLIMMRLISWELPLNIISGVSIFLLGSKIKPRTFKWFRM
ncbi:MAG: rod shape-determining protein MreD [Tissierellia bacterium]|nr:rod shape-determining protein MreD [Tissierellia bacterium]